MLKARVPKLIETARDLFGVDAVRGHKDGSVTVRSTYFYRMSRTTEGHVANVLKRMPNVEVIDSGDRYAIWPKESYFWVKVKRKEAEAVK